MAKRHTKEEKTALLLAAGFTVQVVCEGNNNPAQRWTTPDGRTGAIEFAWRELRTLQNVSRETRDADVSRETSGREFHTALVTQIRKAGDKLPNLLLETFHTYNVAYFDERLDVPCVLITNPASPRALGDYTSRDEHGIESRIRIRPSLTKMGLRYIEHVLLHEMVHAWCHEVEQSEERSYKGHGPVFTAKCNEISKHLGLDLVEVSVKGRHGKPDSARWPMSAFPTEEAAVKYYGNVPKQKTTSAKELGPKLSKAIESHKHTIDLDDALQAVFAALAERTDDPAELVQAIERQLSELEETSA